MTADDLLFAPLVPLVLVAASVAFCTSSFVYKYQSVFVFVSKVESSGVRIVRHFDGYYYADNEYEATLECSRQSPTCDGANHASPHGSHHWSSGGLELFGICVNNPAFLHDSWIQDLHQSYLPPKIPLVHPDQEERQVVVHFEHPDLAAVASRSALAIQRSTQSCFAPMLHAGMMPLLPEVYHGRLKSEEATVDECGGQKVVASAILGRIKIAVVEQSELAYDPALYQRDREELSNGRYRLRRCPWMSRSIQDTDLVD